MRYPALSYLPLPSLTAAMVVLFFLPALSLSHGVRQSGQVTLALILAHWSKQPLCRLFLCERQSRCVLGEIGEYGPASSLAPHDLIVLLELHVANRALGIVQALSLPIVRLLLHNL